MKTLKHKTESAAVQYSFDSADWLFRRLTELGFRTSGDSKKSAFEYIEQALQEGFIAGAKKANDTDAPYRALKVITLDPRISAWLNDNDPKALRQALLALAEVEGDK